MGPALGRWAELRLRGCGQPAERDLVTLNSMGTLISAQALHQAINRSLQVHGVPLITSPATPLHSGPSH